MKFDRREAEKELSSITSEMDITIDEKKYPQLYKMMWRGSDHNINDYFDAYKPTPILGKTAEELTNNLTINEAVK